MKLLIIGGGIGGLVTALALHRAGIDVDIFEQSQELRELGVGINLLPHAVKELAALGLLPALDEAGIRTRELIYLNRHGQVVWRELRGLDAGYDVPQLSIHRGKLHGVLLKAVLERIGPSRLHADRHFVDLKDGQGKVTAFLESRTGRRFEVVGDGLIGADGIHSRVRSLFYSEEGPLLWSGIMLWRGATAWPIYEDGRTMVIAGGNAAKFVFYPIHADPARPDQRLTNWAIMARITDGAGPPPRREDWNAVGRIEEARAFVEGSFHLGFVDPARLIAATSIFYEYPNCDRDPVARWSYGRVTLLGDAAHPMYPVGSNGASQAILDAAALARHLTAVPDVVPAFAAYDAERRPLTADIVSANRRGGPEGVIDMVEARAPDGFDDIDKVASYAEREAIVRGYASMAGYASEQVNRRTSR
ncbi:flavin-dependent oxidoreductase [Nordella sp. HKS 07]|uniref:flavin-dependent oxidoreductase n=1 Tax=Nordella sp. HKS 07 TaxID=2712222 RepID=UPI0013E1CC4F|nr:flavin-dependent oxidoreductase [Nordella sp. HKS 07]QIG50504.1 flavin-dependent oxidoreductase [Nordella sp. HKS 07]